jgi:hypothetical protein
MNVGTGVPLATSTVRCKLPRMSLNTDQKPKIIHAMQESSYRWRTARGLSKDTGIGIEDVVDFLERSPAVVRAKKSNSKGQALYALRDKSVPLGQRIANVILNRPE